MTWSGLIWLTVLAWKLYNYNPVISLEKNEQYPPIGFKAAF